jgi:hypothetical protein
MIAINVQGRAQDYGGNHGKLPAAWVLVSPAPWESRFPGKRLLPVVDDTHSVPGAKKPGACRRVRREITVQEGDECISHFQDPIYFHPVPCTRGSLRSSSSACLGMIASTLPLLERITGPETARSE